MPLRAMRLFFSLIFSFVLLCRGRSMGKRRHEHNVALVNPNTNESTTATMVKIAQEAAPGLHITGVTVRKGACLISNDAAVRVAADEVVSLAPDLAQFDAVIISAFSDPGRNRLAKFLSCPVVGIAEASMAEAAHLSEGRFAVVTTTPELKRSISETAASYGYAASLVSVGTPQGDAATLMADPDSTHEALEMLTRRAISEDGARAIVIGGGPLALAARSLASRCAVPIIEPIPAAVRRVSELLADRSSSTIKSPHFLPTGRVYTFDDLVHWRGKQPGDQLDSALAARLDTIVLSPHASAAIPGELRRFINPTLTLREASDFSDTTVHPIGMKWSSIDPHVVYIHNPHSRVALDPNRAHASGPETDLREFFSRLGRVRAGDAVGFVGCDAVRPVTFANQEVLMEPVDERGWEDLTAALKASAAAGALAYERAVERVVSAVCEAREPSKPLTIIGWHDTCSSKAMPDGSITAERAMADRMPRFANFGNRGGFDAVSKGSGSAALLTPAATVHHIAAAWAEAFGAEARDYHQPRPHACDEDISFNRPYAGGHEVGMWAERLRHRGEATVIFQVEFNRDYILGPHATPLLRAAGSTWPETDHGHVTRLAANLKRAADALRGSMETQNGTMSRDSEARADAGTGTGW